MSICPLILELRCGLDLNPGIDRLLFVLEEPSDERPNVDTERKTRNIHRGSQNLG